MTNNYNEIQPDTIIVDAMVIREAITSIGTGGAFFAHVADGCGAKVYATFGPEAHRAGTFTHEPPVDPTGFLVALDGIGATWVQPTGMMHPEWIMKHLFALAPDGYMQTAAVLAVLITAIRAPDLVYNARDAARDWLAENRAEQVPWLLET